MAAARRLLALAVLVLALLACAAIAARAQEDGQVEQQQQQSEDGGDDDADGAAAEESSEEAAAAGGEGSDSDADGGGEGGGTDANPAGDESVQDSFGSDDGSDSASGEESDEESSSDEDGRVTIIENGNHLNALAEKKQWDEATEARQHEEKLKRDKEAHQKKMDAFARQTKAEENLKSEQALKAKTKRAQEENAKERAREAKAKAAHESTTKKIAEDNAKRLAQKKAETVRREQESAAKGKGEGQQKAKEHAKRKKQLKNHHKDKGKKVGKKGRRKGGRGVRRGGRWGNTWGLSLRSGWRNYGHSYQWARVSKWWRVCALEGLILGNAGLMAHLPHQCRPYQGRLIFNPYRSAEHRVDVLADGRIYRITGSGGWTWTSLASITFDTHIARYLNLGWHWRPYGHSYRRAAETQVNGLCIVSGLIRSGSWNYFARTTHSCFPGQQLIFSGNNHHHQTRVDVRADGYVFRNGGWHSHHWVSLDGIVYARRHHRHLPVYSGWRNYPWGNYRPLGMARIGHLCLISGLLHAAHGWRGHLTTLPRGCRPSRRLIFGANNHQYNARVDVLPNGQVHYINRGGRHGWLSLSNIHFVARQ